MGRVQTQSVRDRGDQLTIYDILDMEEALRPFMVEPLPRAARERIEAAWLLLQQWKQRSLQQVSSAD